MSIAAVPISNSYWVEPGRVLAGEYPGAPNEAAAREKLRLFLDAGVRCFIDLTEPDEYGLVPYAHVLEEEARHAGIRAEYVRLQIPDVSVPHSREHMERILDTIEDALARELVVYVHCWGGAGRTGTVAGCHLVRCGLAGEEALERVAQGWATVQKYGRSPNSPQTEEQRGRVRGW